jgi:hypothetical protein
VVQQAVRHVISMEEPLAQQLGHVDVVHDVEDASPLATVPDQPGETELGEVVGDRGGLSADNGREFSHRSLTLQQGPEQPNAGWIAEKAKALHSEEHLLVCGRLGRYQGI